MKRIILLAALFISTSIFSQEFILTPDDYKDAKNQDKNFVVIDLPGKSQSEIFTLVKKHITSTYKNLKNGYNEVGTEQIVIDVNSIASTVKLLGQQMSVGEFTNRYELNFKDGKMMIKPNFQKLVLGSSSGPDKEILLNGGSALLGQSVFNKKGNVSIKESIYLGMQQRTNDFVTDLTKAINNQSADW